ncbi:MOB kinase activator 2-like isoform X1 [Antedon mediterranea]|uniref:MOB kinase activator 2-like isoform X1 n=1 Tax=Antedon mediterranea TaxID=105859 RepID=UPI003AF82D65
MARAMRSVYDLYSCWPFSIHQFYMRYRRPRKEKKPTTVEEKKLFLEPQYTKSQVIDLDIRELVRLPKGLELNEWLASNCLSFFNNINVLYGVVSEFCTNETCPLMVAPCNTQYFWYDDKGKKMKCTGPQYTDYVMSYIQMNMKDETVFPVKYGQVFPSNIESIMHKILRYLFHVLAHIYHSHFEQLVFFQLHPHLNCVLVQLVLFSYEFHLLESKDFTVLEDLIAELDISAPSDSNKAADNS